MPPKYHLIDGLPKSVSPSSHAAEADGFVFLTGQFGRDLDNPDAPLPEGIEAQTERTLANMKRVLGALGLTMENVASVRVFLTQFKRDYAAMNAVYARQFSQPYPARTTIGVASLPLGARVEIELIARRD